jgi:DNA-binding NarL/FixJ family response regulator
MRVAIAEDDPVYRAGLVELLTAAGVAVAYQASSGQELLGHLAGNLPDAVLLDIRMKGRPDDGLTTAEVIAQRYPDLGILLLSNYDTEEYVRRFFAHGTAGRGYLLKEQFNDIDDVSHALNLVQRRKTFSDTPILDRLHRRQPAITELLTPRELEVVRLLAAGLSNAAIAAQLRIKEDKVEYAIQSIYTKLDIPRTPDQNPRVHAAVRWLQEMPEGWPIRDMTGHRAGQGA